MVESGRRSAFCLGPIAPGSSFLGRQHHDDPRYGFLFPLIDASMGGKRRRWKRKPYRRQYNASHRAKRKALSSGSCGRRLQLRQCHQPILPGQAWDLGRMSMATVCSTPGPNAGIRVTVPKVGIVRRLVTARSGTCMPRSIGRGRESGEPLDRRSLERCRASGDLDVGPRLVRAGFGVVASLGLVEHAHHVEKSLNQVAFSATVHCLTAVPRCSG